MVTKNSAYIYGKVMELALMSLLVKMHQNGKTASTLLKQQQKLHQSMAYLTWQLS